METSVYSGLPLELASGDGSDKDARGGCCRECNHRSDRHRWLSQRLPGFGHDFEICAFEFMLEDGPVKISGDDDRIRSGADSFVGFAHMNALGQFDVWKTARPDLA